MLKHLTFILVCQLAGELLAKALHLSVPGPVIGMALLFAFLLWRGGIPEELAVAADGLLRHLSLLFVPAGVGVMLHFRLIGDDWLAVGAALVVSTVLTIAVTALMMDWLGRRAATGNGEGRDDG